MKNAFAVLAAAGVVVSATASAGTLELAFVQPERYTDAWDLRAPATQREAITRGLERHLRQLAQRKLPAGDALQVEVLDIDLAGTLEPTRWRPGDNLRIVRDFDGARLRLRYAWTRGDRVLAQGEEALSNSHTLAAARRLTDDDRLRHEKVLLDDWFERRFVRGEPLAAASQ